MGQAASKRAGGREGKLATCPAARRARGWLWGMRVDGQHFREGEGERERAAAAQRELVAVQPAADAAEARAGRQRDAELEAVAL